MTPEAPTPPRNVDSSPGESCETDLEEEDERAPWTVDETPWEAFPNAERQQAVCKKSPPLDQQVLPPTQRATRLLVCKKSPSLARLVHPCGSDGQHPCEQPGDDNGTEHVFVPLVHYVPTWCESCNAVLSVLWGQTWQCQVCRQRVCDKCKDRWDVCPREPWCPARDAMLQAGRQAKEEKSANSGKPELQLSSGVHIDLGDLPLEVNKCLTESLAIHVVIKTSPSGLNVARFVHSSMEDLFAPFMHCRLNSYAEYGQSEASCEKRFVSSQLGVGTPTVIALMAFENADYYYFSLELNHDRLELMFGCGELFRRYALLFKATGEERDNACHPRDVAPRPVIQHETSHATVGDVFRWMCCAIGRMQTNNDSNQNSRAFFMGDLQKFLLGLESVEMLAYSTFRIGNSSKSREDKAGESNGDAVSEADDTRAGSKKATRRAGPAKPDRKQADPMVLPGAEVFDDLDGDVMLGNVRQCSRNKGPLHVDSSSLGSIMLNACEVLDDVYAGVAEAEAAEKSMVHGVEHTLEASESSWRKYPGLEKPVVKRTTVQALGEVADRGHAQSIEVVTRALLDPDEEVREAALQALMQLSDTGDFSVFFPVMGRLDDINPRVRKAAVEAIAIVAQKGDERAVKHITYRLNDKDWTVRRSAAKTLGRVAKTGDAFAISAVATNLAEGYDFVTHKVAKTLTEVLQELSLSRSRRDWLNSQKDHVDMFIKQAVVEAQHSDIQPLVAVTSSLEAEYSVVRQALVQTLQQLAEKGDKQAILALWNCLPDPQVEVVESAMQALGQVALKGDQETQAVLKKFLTHANWVLRCSAVQVLSLLVTKEDSATIAAISACLKDSDEAVRDAATEALNALSC